VGGGRQGDVSFRASQPEGYAPRGLEDIAGCIDSSFARTIEGCRPLGGRTEHTGDVQGSRVAEAAVAVAVARCCWFLQLVRISLICWMRAG
jgi:hypothetical protein